ncbi:MAG: glutamate--tRNA ligase [Candidatus Komeilibacteria bacterium RIFCSPLOWO2_02_FULL_48_11]|uniref:Glutamate--tRNA ligase n=1 Tax=Candidatus Komeilibacteria bacterium RIFCSPLOWO2_02_FULL_48_11 TaxID=1798553 RepID=A0A1G2BVG3_9BACT|nr:MAG: glutamate--tRNA ligase [Candidatus Komeilibacteria bacterium RIFCSPLOWO2_02_FULL_48_11]
MASKHNNKIRVRFAPSPTGAPHVGNIRTALFAWLFARHHKGTFILRIEDTDTDRVVAGSVETILEALDWLGLEVDEGVKSFELQVSSQRLVSLWPTSFKKEKNGVLQEVGEYGPYFQSKRLDIYKKYAEELVAKGHAYYCFCSEERLEQIRKEQEAKKLPPKYNGHCLTLDAAEVKKLLDGGEAHVIRMKIGHEGETVLNDVIKGEVRFKNSLIDDQVLLKSDGFPTYHLAAVVDDHLMEISHVIRADEWLPSTPKHLLLYDYFGWAKPAFAHVPIILGPDKTKLSKRHGAVSILDYREAGYLPEAMFNYLAFLGWNPKTDQELFSRDELIKEFDLDKVNKANPIFDIKKLNWMNGQYIKKMTANELQSVILNEAKRSEGSHGLILGSFANAQDDALKKVVKLAQERMEKLVDFAPLTDFLRQDKLDYDAKILIPKGLSQTQCKTQLQTALDVISKIEAGDWQEEKLRKTFLDYCEKNNVKRGELLWPVRVAVTGLANSPDLFAVMDILGKKKSIERIREAISKL